MPFPRDQSLHTVVIKEYTHQTTDESFKLQNIYESQHLCITIHILSPLEAVRVTSVQLTWGTDHLQAFWCKAIMNTLPYLPAT